MPLPGPHCDGNDGLCRCLYAPGRSRPQRTASTPTARRSGCGLVTLIGFCVLLAVALGGFHGRLTWQSGRRAGGSRGQLRIRAVSVIASYRATKLQRQLDSADRL